MANVAVRSSAKASNPSTASITVTAPAGTTTGDLVIVAVASNNNVTLSDGNGATPFTKDYTGSIVAEGMTFAIFSRRIVGDDPSVYTFTHGASATRMSAVAVTFSNPHSSTIFDPSEPTSLSATKEIASSNVTQAITTSINNSIHCLVATSDLASNVITPPTGDGYNEEQQSTDQAISFCTKVITPEGTTGTHTFSISEVAGSITQSFAIRNMPAITLTLDNGNYSSTGQATTLRLGSFTYLRHRK
jgi:hypothetical protein